MSGPNERLAPLTGQQHTPHDHADSAWNRAINGDREGDPFSCRSEWQLTAHEIFAPGRSLHVRADGTGAAAFAGWHDPLHGPTLGPLEANWMFGCPLLGDGAFEHLHHLIDEVRREIGMRPDLYISGITPRSPLAERVLAGIDGTYTPHAMHRETHASACLRGGLDGWLSRRSARVRRNVRAAARRVHDRGVQFERHAPRTAVEAEQLYRRMLAVEERSWKGIGACGMAEYPSRPFYRRLMRRLAAGGLARVILAHHEHDGDVGFVFGGMHGGCYRGQQFSYVDSWRSASLGNVMQVEQVAWLCEEGALRYDLGPMMEYKRHWAETRRSIRTAYLRRSA